MDLASNSCSLEGADVHGFHSLGDLRNFLGEASSRWLRPNEVLAVLCNYKYFKIQPQPVDKPESGHVLLFDRKMLRNFRQDGHRWKRKKDGKSIQEAHEKLKIGNEERIHVYYARGEHEPSFYRRSYWLLDKNKDRIVLVHYRRLSEEKREHLSTPMESKEVSPSTKKMQYDSPTTPVNSTSGSAHSELSGSAALSEEINSGGQTAHIGSDSSLVCGGTGLRNNEFGLDDIETLEWSDELGDIVQACISTDSGCVPPAQQMQYDLRNNYLNDSAFLPPKETASYWRPSEVVDRTGCSDAKLNGGYSHIVESQQNPQLGFSDVKQMSDVFSQFVEDEQNPVPLFNAQVMDCISNQNRNEISQIYTDGVFSSQSSFGRWNYVNDDSLGSLHGQQFGGPSQNGDFTHKEIFTIVDISPTWAYCTEATKVILIGSFDESNKHLAGSNMYCIIGKKCVAAEMVLNGVYRCTVMGQNLGMVNLFLTLDGNTPISQVLSFEYRSVPGTCAVTKPLEEDTVELSKMTSQVQRRLAHLLFSTTNTISILSNTRHLSTLRKAQKFADLTSPLMDKEWRNLLDISGNDDGSHVPRSEDLFELLLKNKLQEWLLNRVVEGCTITARDFLGQGAIHLCAILDYAWAVHLFLSSGLSLDFRDAYGWTALHWAAYYGR